MTNLTKGKAKPELAIATWPADVNNITRYIGDREYAAATDECSSFRLHLRLVNRDDEHAFLDTRASDISDIGLWVFLSAGSGSRSHSIEVQLQDVHSADLRKAERLVKELRTFTRKMPEPNPDFAVHITRVVDALGIKTAVEYHGVATKNTYVSIDRVLPRIVALFNERMAVCERNVNRNGA
jgi:hypothetical protein